MGFIENYKASHTHPVNKALHTIGIPAIVISVVFFFVDWLHFSWQYWYVTVGLFVGGWILQFIGHAFEGKPPSFFSNPIYLLVGPVWWFLKVTGLKKGDSENSK